MNRVDLTKKKGTIGNVFAAHRDEILGVKSSQEAYQLVKRLFEENSISTPKSRQILMKLQSGMGYVQTVTYLNNIIMKSQGLGTLETEQAVVEESEAAFGNVGSIFTHYCRDLVLEDAPDDADLKVAELDVVRGDMPIDVSDADMQSMKQQTARSRVSYRFIAYYVDCICDSRWYDAIDKVHDEDSFNDYVDEKNPIYSTSYEDYPDRFAAQFKSYDQWKSYLGERNASALKQILSSSGKLPYQSLASDVKVNADGTAYVIIGWRA